MNENQNNQPYESTSSVGCPGLGEGNPNISPEPPQGYAPPPMPVYADIPKPVRQRRVGTFTLGLTLILIGLLVPLSLIYQEQAWALFKFAPVVLVFLGIEVLIFAFRYKDGKLKYDGLSVFLAIALTVVSLICSAVVPPLSGLYHNSRLVHEQVLEGRESLEDILVDLGFDGEVYTASQDDEWRYLFPNRELSRENIPFQATINLSWINLDHPEQEEVTEAFYRLVSRASQLDRMEGLWIGYDYQDDAAAHRYWLDLGRSTLKNPTKESIERQLVYVKDVFDDSTNPD